MGATNSPRSARAELGESGGSVHLPQDASSQPGDMGGPLSSDSSARALATSSHTRGDIGGDDPGSLDRSLPAQTTGSNWAHPSGSGGSGGSGDRPNGYPSGYPIADLAISLDPGGTDERDGTGTDEADPPGDEQHINEPALPTGASGGSPEATEDTDDDFGDFEGNMTTAIPEPTSTHRELENEENEENKENEENEDEDWEFAPVAQAAAPLSPGDQNKSVQKLLENWLESMGPIGPMGAQNMARMLGGMTGMGMVRGEDENLVTDWDSWLQSANIPEEAHELITNGISSDKVPVVPFAKLGVKAEQTTFGTRVRDNFWQVLGKHLQLPSAKPEMPSSPGSPGSPGVGTQHQSDVKGVCDTVQTVQSNQSVESGAGTAGAASMVDADWGLLETVGTTQTSNVEATSNNDVLSQALSSVGLTTAPAAQPASMSAPLPADLLEAAPAPKKKKGMTHKVKNFLAGLPDLKHLYSKSVFGLSMSFSGRQLSDAYRASDTTISRLGPSSWLSYQTWRGNHVQSPQASLFLQAARQTSSPHGPRFTCVSGAKGSQRVGFREWTSTRAFHPVMAPKPKVPPKAKGSGDDDSDLEDLRQAAPANSKEEAPRQQVTAVKPRSEIPKPQPAYQLHEPWAVPLRAGAQAETYRLEGPAAARAGGHRPALQRFSAEIGSFNLSALRSAEVQGYRAYEDDSLSEAESQDSQESLSGNVHSRWDPTRTERRYAYGGDASVKFSGVRRIEWNPIEWKDKLLQANHLGTRTPAEKMKAAVFKVMAMNRVYKGITSPPAEWQIEVERQKAGRMADEMLRLKKEKERVDRAKQQSKIGRKDARANARLERQARIEKELMQQNTQAQLLVEHMEEALLKVPELRPPSAPELHPNEVLQAKLVIHDLATSGLGEKVSEMAGGKVQAANHQHQPATGKAALNNWLAEVRPELHSLNPRAVMSRLAFLSVTSIFILAVRGALLDEADGQNVVDALMSFALTADDSCSRETPNACGLGALQAAMHARSSKERSQDSSIATMAMDAQSMLAVNQTADGAEVLAALEHFVFKDSDLHLNQSQIDKLFNGVVLAIASEAERKNQNLLGRKILRLLRKSALDAFKVKNPSPRYFEFPWRGFSWVEEEAIETARASMALPITGGSILVLALVSLNFFHRTFSRSKDYQEALPRPGRTSPGLDTSSTVTPPLSDNLETGFEDRVEEASTLQGSAHNDDYAASISSGDEASPQVKKEEEARAPFLALFRFATTWDMFCTMIAVMLGAVHGTVMPMAFFFLSDLYHAIYMPNDDGSLPPVNSPHSVRDTKVAEVGMTYILLALVVLCARTGGCYMAIHAADRQVVAARRQYFHQILMQGPSWHDLHQANELAPQLVQDTHLFRDGIGERLVDFSRAVAMALSASALACTRDWKISILMAVVMPIAGLCMALSVEVVRNFSMVVEACYAKAGEVCVTATELIKTVTAFNGQKAELETFNGHVDEASSTAIQIGVVAGYATGLVNTVLICGMSLGVYFGSIWVLQDYESDCWRSSPPFGNCRTGGTILSAMYTVVWGFTMGLGTMNMCFSAFANAKAAIHRINAILDEPIHIVGGSKTLDKVQGAITFSEVCFSYPKRPDALVLKSVSVTIPAGCTTAFVGSSGSGKSTMISLLLRFYEPDSGQVSLDGNDIRSLDLHWLRSKLALVEQEPILFQDPVYDNIALGCKGGVSKADVEQAAKLASAHDFIMSFPMGYQTKVGEAGTQLSGGQKQRLAIARALIRKPAVLLLDEATSALDSASERQVQKALDELLELGGRTTIVVAHRLSTVRHAHQICVLDKGKLAESGTHDELMRKEGAYEKLLRLQLSVQKEEEEASSSPKQDDVKADDAHAGGAQMLLQRAGSPKDSEEKAAGEDSYLEKAKKYDFGKDLGAKYAVSQVWKLTKQDYKYYIIGVGFTMLGAFVMPYFSVQFSLTVNIFNQPPAVLDPKSKNWYAAYNEPLIASNVSNLCMLMQALSIFWLLQAIGGAWAFAKAGELLCVRVRGALFEALLRQEVAWHDKQGTGQILWKLGADIPQLKTLVGANIASAANFFFTTIIGIGVAMYYSWRFCLCILITMPLLGISSIGVAMNMRAIEGDYSSGIVSESVNSVKTVTAFGLQPVLLEKYERKLEEHMTDERGIRKLSALGTGVASGSVFMILAMAVWGINLFISRGLMEVDIATVVVMTLVTTVSAFGELARLISDTTLPQDAARRIFNVIARRSKIDPFSTEGAKLDQVKGHVEFREVYFRYATRPNLPVFDGLSFIVEPGTTTALVGPSGCGKSTSVALLQRFYDPLGGCVLFDGHDITTLNLQWYRSQMSLVQQEPILFARSILDNIRYGQEDATMEEVEAAAKAANASDFITALPQGFSTQSGHRGAQLSGGQKQRIAIARALLRDPAANVPVSGKELN
eukprot:s1905_g6.t2